MQNVGTWAECDVLVFASGAELSLACVAADDRDTIAAEAVAKGWLYAGSIAIDHKGEPSVCIEPGCTAAMARAGLLFVRMLASQIEQRRLATEGVK